MGKDDRAKVRGRLRKYKLLGARAKNLELQKAHLEKELALYHIPTVDYTNMRRGSGEHKSPVEITSARREDITARLARLQLDMEALQIEKMQIDNAVAALPDDLQEVTTAFYFEGLSFPAVCLKLGYSERTLRRRQVEALEALAVALL